MSKKNKSLRKKFKEEALRLNLNISYELTWNSNIAGIDILKKQFLFVQEPDSGFVIKHLNLNKISQIKLVSQYAEFDLQKKRVQTLSSVDLEFFENGISGPIMVNLFNYDLNYTEDFEIKNAEKLVAELKKYLNAQPLLKRTA
tara:strand:+ start:102 stop:530 length:429 start_codon:yes stop_codon:yes gene_type:complete